MIKTISHDDVVQLRDTAERSARRRAHRNFHQSYDEPIQRLLIAIETDSYIRPHRHVGEGRWEFMLLMSGAAVVLEFDDAGVLCDRIELNHQRGAVGVEIQPNSWHAIVATEPKTVLFEFKPGPYLPVMDKDFAQWAPIEGDHRCSRYLDWYRRAQTGERFE